MKTAVCNATPEGTVELQRTCSDSTILRQGDPLFLPDHLADSWNGTVCPAIKICRLGTNIRPKAASRFIGEFSLVLLLDAPEGSEAARNISILDRSCAPGIWVEGDRLTDEPTGIADNCGSFVCHTGLRGEFEDAICRLSKFATFKTGDIIVLRHRGLPPKPLAPDTEVKASALSQELLHIRIK